MLFEYFDPLETLDAACKDVLVVLLLVVVVPVCKRSEGRHETNSVWGK